MYRLIILAAITVALCTCGKAQSCINDSINVSIPFNGTLQCVAVELKLNSSRESVSNFSNVSSELVNLLPKPSNPDYKAFEFVSCNVNDTSISLFLHFHRK